MNPDNSHKKIEYVYNLPIFESEELCKILDQNEKWEELAGVWMKFDDLTIKNLKREKRPTNKLLDLWGHHNHTIVELFILLSKMKCYEPMEPLKQFVDSKYHVLIGNSRRKEQRVDQGAKNLRIGIRNLNRPEPVSKNVPKVPLHQPMQERVAKILNGSPQPNTDLVPSNSDNMLVQTDPNKNLSPVPKPMGDDCKNNENQLMVSPMAAALPNISYKELAEATNNWNSYTILGKGGFGTVFRGKWKNTQVAIKRIEQRGPETTESYSTQLEQSMRELKILSACRHDNILCLYAYSMGGDAPCLVYQFMSNGSLEDRLLLRQNTTPLNWLQRHEIAKGTARGLQFLHTLGNKPLIHGDIKSANILLDKNYEPKIGDFGLAREGPETDFMRVSRVQGTRPYLPDEFLQHKNLSTKIDTYSYGIVLLELATGSGAYSNTRPANKFLKDFVDSYEEKDLPLLMDQKAGVANQQVYLNLIILGKWCSNRLSEHRPEMVSVLRKLDDLSEMRREPHHLLS